jgi:hypothetical protein
MSTLLLSAPVTADAAPSVEAASQWQHLRRQWLLSPVADLLLILNVAWPLVVWLQVFAGMSIHDETLFWQVYFVTTPHRWITLAYVFLDREQMRSRGPLLIGIFLTALGACGMATLATGTLTCLLTVDYLWNVWHFAAQHHGIFRIYSRGQGRSTATALAIERWTFRGIVLYVSARVAGGTWAWPQLDQALRQADWLVLGVALALLVSVIARQHFRMTTSLGYLVSVLSLYGGMLLAVNQQQPSLVLAFATAAALFHALEYLGVVTWSLQKKSGAEHGWLSRLALQAGGIVVAFALVLGSGAWLVDNYWSGGWLFLNVAAAFTHYAFDGLIWRRGGGH